VKYVLINIFTVGYLLPSLKATRLQFLQDILHQDKKALLAKNVPARRIPHWPQLAVKLIYPQIIEMRPQIKEYLPDISGKGEDRYPERDFFYRVVNSLYPDIVTELIN
jgi:hypothetical protein